MEDGEIHIESPRCGSFSVRMCLSNSRCISMSAEARVLGAVTGHGPIPPHGGTHFQVRSQAQSIIVPTREARTRYAYSRCPSVEWGRRNK
ncbi:hypothetical protein AVEN_34969-1 [Araneus ventricosus]|uniref:Uncharacterized protein n=1 Tax=Araneus ventricosus TaxID=182803 RepID=A0A4Y2DET4_ARAVE|nr:hypothetical protein AVEN_34969-1 [Araneus ventricosus]